MAGQKRPRPEDGDVEHDNLEDSTSQSSHQSDSRKKSRHVPERHPEDSDASTDEDLEEREAAEFSRKQRAKEHVRNKPADNGIVESITLTNFMCHEFLHVELGPLINFVIGHNGSGKSAVLTALTICLGAKASSTNRGGSLKSFIANGKESCTLAVKLKNQGDTAFQQDVYGDSIIVERHFTKAGSSGFKIKSKNGRVISTKKADLEDISDYYALQLDNPMTVLSQDMARQFLNSSTPADKYRFMIRGIQLEQLSQDYRLLEDNIDAIASTVELQTDKIEDLKKKKQSAEQKLRMSEKHDALRKEIAHLSQQMAWSQVEEQEATHREIGHELVRTEASIVSKTAEVDDASKDFERADRVLADHGAKLKEADAALTPLNNVSEGADRQRILAKQEAHDTAAQHRKIRESIHSAKVEIADHHASIAEEERRLDEASGGQHARRRQDLDDRLGEAKGRKTILDDHLKELPALRAASHQAEKEQEDCQPRKREKDAEVRECQDRLNSILRDRGREQNGFHPQMQALRKAIEEDRGFQHPPIGPLGRFIRLKEARWSGLLEKTLGGTLSAFIVMSKPDQVRLSAIMQRLRCTSSIYIGNDQSFDFSQHEPEEKYLTILRALEIEHPAVLRQLVISNAIEQTILMDRREEAVALMNGQRLRNVKACLAQNDRAGKGTGVRLTYSHMNAISSSPVLAFQGAPRMKTDVEYQIRAQQQRLADVKNERTDLDRQSSQLETKFKRCQGEISRHQSTEKKLRSEWNRVRAEAVELQTALDNDAIEEGRLDELKNNLAQSQRAQSLAEDAYQESTVELDRLKAGLAERQVELAAAQVRVQEAEVTKKGAQASLDEADTRRYGVLLRKNQSIVDLENLRTRKTGLEEQRQAKGRLVEEFIFEAGRVCPRVPIEPGNTSELMERKLQNLTNDINASERRLGGDAGQISRQFSTAVRRFNDAKIQFENQQAFTQFLTATLIERQSRWDHFQKEIIVRARLMFTHLMSERAFQGKIAVDHKKKLLQLKVQPDKNQKSRGGETHGLSGGEKSFSTICLLLALWDAMGAPIRCLDEFDVFMDSINRHISMKMLINIASRQTSRQFIFITPQAVSSLQGEDGVKIIKMPDPPRTDAIGGQQTRLTFPIASQA